MSSLSKVAKLRAKAEAFFIDAAKREATRLHAEALKFGPEASPTDPFLIARNGVFFATMPRWVRRALTDGLHGEGPQVKP